MGLWLAVDGDVFVVVVVQFKLLRCLYRFIYNVACENSRLSSLLAAKGVSPQRQKYPCC